MSSEGPLRILGDRFIPLRSSLSIQAKPVQLPLICVKVPKTLFTPVVPILTSTHLQRQLVSWRVGTARADGLSQETDAKL